MSQKDTQFDPLFVEAGLKYGVNPAVLKAIASVESSFNPKAVGPKTRSGQAKGLMQFVPATAKAYGLKDPFDAEQSIDAAARLMRDLNKQFKGDLGKALEAYNGGPRLVGKSTETAKYRDKVLHRVKLANQNEKFTGLASQMATKQLKPNPIVPPKEVADALPDVKDFPPTYKAALALQYFVEEEKDKGVFDGMQDFFDDLLSQEGEAAVEEEEVASGGQVLKQLLTTAKPGESWQQTFMSKFQEPRSTTQVALSDEDVAKFADGGFVFRGTSLPGAPNWMLDAGINYTTSDLKAMSSYEAAMDQYQKDVDQYNSLLASWQKEADAFNAEVNAWNAGPRTSNFVPTVRNPGEFNVKFESKLPASTESYETWMDIRAKEINAARDRYEKELPQREQRQLALDVATNPSAYNLSGFGFKDGGAVDKRGMLDTVKAVIKELDLGPADLMYLTKQTMPLGLLMTPSGLNEGEDEYIARLKAEYGEQPVERSEGSPMTGEVARYTPSADEVPQLNPDGTVRRSPRQPDPERSFWDRLLGAGEAAATIATSTVAAPAGAVYGLYKGLTSDKLGTEEGNKEAEAAAKKLTERMTYLPKGEAGREALEGVARFMQESKLDAPLPMIGFATQAPAIGLRALRQGVELPVEQASLAAMKKITGNKDVTMPQVFDAMSDTKGIASLAAPNITRPGGLAPPQRLKEPFIQETLEVLAEDTPGGADPKAVAMSNPELVADLNKFLETKAKSYFASNFSAPKDPLRDAFLNNKYTPKALTSDNLTISATIFEALATRNKNDPYTSPQNILDLTGIPLLRNNMFGQEHLQKLQELSASGNADAKNLLHRMYDAMSGAAPAVSGKQMFNAFRDPEKLKAFQDYVIRIQEQDPDNVRMFRALGLNDEEALQKLRDTVRSDLQNGDQVQAKFYYRPFYLDFVKEQMEQAAIKQGADPSDLRIVPDPLLPEVSELDPWRAEEIARGNPVLEIDRMIATPEEVAPYIAENPEALKKSGFADLVIAASNRRPMEEETRLGRIGRAAVDDGYVPTEKQLALGVTPYVPVASQALGDGAKWIQFDDPLALRLEGALMNHCIKRKVYSDKMRAGEARYFSLRDSKNRPVVTIEMEPDTDGEFSILSQIKGFENESRAEEFGPEITEFVQQYQQDLGTPVRIYESQQYVPKNLLRSTR